MTSSSSWWPLIGSIQTATGMSVGVESTLRNGPANAATRLLAETLAGLPCMLKRRTGVRQSEDATDHPLWRVAHNQPNTEQDSMGFFDLQVGFQVLCGNAYAEVQRDDAGRPRAWWPIHPSRLPVCNIRRNGRTADSWRHIVVGQPGEIVYYVRNDDETVTPIPASDMLHVPGIQMNSNGITGRGVPEFAAEALGIAMATDAHAAAFFRNGAVSNVAIKSTKVVGKEVADRLREQWQRTFGGVRNHYKTLLLEDGMDAVPFSIDPERSQLTLARQFNTTDVARFWRVQPHLIGDLSRSTNNNIEQQGLEFVTYTMLPWIIRWERAMWRQLLTEQEKANYYFKFNVNGLLRGDMAARSALYQVLFNLGAMSPNDIRELEDLNAIPGGDQYFVQGNNAVPLDKIGELVQSQIDATNRPTPEPQPAPEPDQTAANIERVIRTAVGELKQCDAAQTEKMVESIRQMIGHEIGEHVAPMVEKVEEGVKTLAETQESTLTAMKEAVSTDFKSASQALVSSVDAIARIVDASQKEVNTTVSSLRESQSSVAGEIKCVKEAVSEGFAATVEQVKASIPAFPTPESIAETVETRLKPLVEVQKQVIDTTREEQLAKRELELQQAAEMQAATLDRQRTAAINAVTAAISRDFKHLAEWEAKWALKATEKPLAWKEARTSFYMRFTRHFTDVLREYSASLGELGVSIDPEWCADRYAASSIADLKTLDPMAADNYHDRLKEGVKHFCNTAWTDRPSLLARELIERGDSQKKEKSDV